MSNKSLKEFSPNTLPPHHDEELIDLTDILKNLVDNKWLILTVSCICLILGGLYSATRASIYETDAIIQIEENQAKNNFFANAPALLWAQRATQVLTQTALIKSRIILDPVVESLGLTIHAAPTPSPSWLSWLSPTAKKPTITIAIAYCPNM